MTTGIADNFVAAAIADGPGKLYVDLGGTIGQWDGAPNIRLLLASDGTPLLSQNPNARHAGYTGGGTEFLIKPTFFTATPDEELDPVIVSPLTEEKVISGSLWQILDMSLMEIFNPTSTRGDVGGSQGLTWGGATGITYTSAAVIFPLQGYPGEYGVFHLYKCYNDQGLAAKITRKAVAEMPFALRGIGISSRTAGDKSGRYFRQTVVGS